jgi:hypothetical protein
VVYWKDSLDNFLLVEILRVYTFTSDALSSVVYVTAKTLFTLVYGCGLSFFVFLQGCNAESHS